MNSSNKTVISPEVARALLWQQGELSYKLHATQLKIYQDFKSIRGRRYILNCSRQLGKSYLLCVIAIEHALRIPNAQVRYAAPTAKMVMNIIKPSMRRILGDCPPELKPHWSSAEGKYIFKNGSEIQIAGTEAGHDDDLRGSKADLCIVDEAGFMNDLDYLIKDILMPQLLHTKGRILIASTPARISGHPFEIMAKEARLRGNYAHYTIFDNPMLTQETIDEYIEDAGGIQSTTWRREYLAEFVIDEELQVLPEFNEERHVGEWAIPTHRDCYVAMDIGFRDLTFVVFGYWDFKAAKLIIEDELAIERVRTDKLANSIKDIEFKLWAGKQPYTRVSDTDLIVINDLSQLHKLNFVPTEKDDKESQINHLRLLLQKDQLKINPRCRQLILHCKMATWDEKKRSFSRVPGYGHFDGVDALVYLVRNVRQGKNPFPAEWYETPQLERKPLSLGSSSSAHAIRRLVNVQDYRRK